MSVSLSLSLSLSLSSSLSPPILHSRPLPAMHLKRSQGFHGSDCCRSGNGSRWRKVYEKMLSARLGRPVRPCALTCCFPSNFIPLLRESFHEFRVPCLCERQLAGFAQIFLSSPSCVGQCCSVVERRCVGI